MHAFGATVFFFNIGHTVKIPRQLWHIFALPFTVWDQIHPILVPLIGFNVDNIGAYLAMSSF